MKVLAFDPGLKGGVAGFDGNTTFGLIMPVAGNELDLATISRLVSDLEPDIIVIEKVHSMKGQGVSSTFKFGDGYGSLKGIAAALNIPFQLVPPQTWKTVLNGTAKDKAAAIAYCRRVFPSVNLIPEKCRVPHDGIADALCILDYGRRTFSF